MPASAPVPALFLDRDGIVNVDHGYVYRIEDFTFVPGIFELARTAQAAGRWLVIVTNQSGIARGRYGEADYQRLTAWMQARFATEGAPLAGVWHCPHLPGAPAPYGIDCDCRKPAPGLILAARDALGLDLARSVLIGDKARDIESARRAGVGRAWLVSGERTEIDAAAADGVWPSVAALAADARAQAALALQ